MFDLSTDHDPLTPNACQLLAQIGADPAAVRETLAEDFVRRCPDREVLADAVPDFPSEREAGEG